jgi:hypothetical protein
VKELISNYQNRGGFLRKTTATAAMLVSLTACEQQPKITDGTVYKKQYTEERTTLTPLITGFSQTSLSNRIPEEWRVYIAQCQKGELPPQDKIKKACKTNSFAVPQEIYNHLQIGQHIDFKQTK